MAGHSQFKNIMHRKGAQDAKRAKIFTKLIKEITVSAKMGGGDINTNPRLRSAIAAAKNANMPKDNIDRAIAKATGGDDVADYQEVRYEGYGPQGVAVIVEALTDNRNRTAAEVRSIFNKNGGSMGETNSVSFLFDYQGYLVWEKINKPFDELLEDAINNGADDINELDDNGVEVFCAADSLHNTREALAKIWGEPQMAERVWKPKSITEVEGDAQKTLEKLIDSLEDNDDVQKVFSNSNIGYDS